MDNKGFTISELLAAIVIVGILTTIATAAVNTIIIRVNHRNYEALIKQIEIAAETYTTQVNKRAFFVEDLIKEGLIDSTENMIINPIDKTTMNCRAIEVIYENGIYQATVQNESYEIENNICDETGLMNSDLNFTIEATKLSGNNYEIVVKCPENYILIVTSNTGYYQIETNTTTNTYTYNHTFASDMTITITATLKNLEENIIKTKREIIVT